MKTYFDCWAGVAKALFSQALAGEPQLAESLPKPLSSGSFGYSATFAGEVEGRFSILVDEAVLEAPLMGDGADQKTGWTELMRETVDAAAGELLASAGKKCHVASFEEATTEGHITQAFELRWGERSWSILVRDELRIVEATPGARFDAKPDAPRDSQPGAVPGAGPESREPMTPATVSPGLELLLDVELEASLRFGSREMPLGEILELGPGDVVELDRHVADPADLIVGDKIVARGEVVLVNGNFALRVTDVAAPRRRLESIRCLF